MAPKIGTGEDYSCWDDGMARRKVGEEEPRGIKTKQVNAEDHIFPLGNDEVLFDGK